MRPQWIVIRPNVDLGLLTKFLDDEDPRPAREQIDANYQHGGGWRPFKGHTLTEEGLCYPGDPPMSLLAATKLRDETIVLFECSWLVIIQRDGSFEVSRVD